MIFSITLPIFLGYFFKKLKTFEASEIKILRKFVVRVTVPFIIFNNLYKTDTSSLGQIFPQALSFTIITIIFAATSYFLVKIFVKDKREGNSYIFAVFIGNYGYLGWGVMSYFYGEGGFTRSVFFSMLFWPVFLFIGFVLVYLRNRSTVPAKQVAKMICDHSLIPLSITVLAVLVNVYQVEIPLVLKDFIASISAITIPMILFTVGLNFKFRMKLNNVILILTGAFHRLIIGFGIGFSVYYLVSFIYPLDVLSAKVIILESAMPTAAMSTLFSEFIDMKNDLHAAITTYSTLFCFVSIPILYYVVENILFLN